MIIVFYYNYFQGTSEILDTGLYEGVDVNLILRISSVKLQLMHVVKLTVVYFSKPCFNHLAKNMLQQTS